MGWGVFDYPSPPEQTMPICPECGEECETIYRGRDGQILGCENCVDALNAYDWEEMNRDE